jgi:hypothetical protein
MTKHVGLSETDLQRYRMSKVVPLMPDFYVGDPGKLETYVEMAKTMAGAAGAFTSKFR